MNINKKNKGCISSRLKVSGISILMSGLLGISSSAAYAGSLSTEEELGRALFQDMNLSLNKNQSCASCHSLKRVKLFGGNKTAAPGFVDPENVATGSVVSDGSVSGKFGSLNSPSAGYAALSPDFHFDEVRARWIGGQFWNGRAATLEDQAKGPFLNPVEMAMPSRWAVISEIKNNERYVRAFEKVYGFDLDAIPSSLLAPSDDNAPAEVFQAYDLVASAIANFERSPQLNAFNSKFDYVEAGITRYTEQEARGKVLFQGRAKCSICHVMDPATGPDGNTYPTVFTGFTYANIGVPRNTSVPGNPSPDIGLAATTGEASDNGKHKVMSLRNIALTSPYGHNGYFATLEEIVHFYNTRDVAAKGWALPEVTENVNRKALGNLGLSKSEEADIVAFLKTLTDNYPKWGKDKNVPQGSASPWQ